jgi:hypothetical protein
MTLHLSLPGRECLLTTRRALFLQGIAALGALILCVAVASSSHAQSDTKDKKKGSQQKETAPPVEVRKVLVFPSDSKGGTSDAVGDDIVGVAQSRLAMSKLYEPIIFRASIPTVQLALTEQQLTHTDVRKPFDNDAKLKKLSGITGYDMVFVSSIDDYEYDATKNQVSVVMSARLIDYSGAKAVVRSAAQSAASPANGGNTPELKVASDLVRSLMDKLMTSILTPKPTTK